MRGCSQELQKMTFSFFVSFVDYLHAKVHTGDSSHQDFIEQSQRCKLMGIDPNPLLKSGEGLFDAVGPSVSLFDGDKPVDSETADRVRSVWAYDRFVRGKYHGSWIADQEKLYLEKTRREN